MGLSLSLLLLSSPWVEILRSKVFGLVQTGNFVLGKSLSFCEDTKLLAKTASLKMRDLEAVPTTKEPKKKVLEPSLSFKNWGDEKPKLQITLSFKMQNFGDYDSESFKLGGADPGAVVDLHPVTCLPEFLSPRPIYELDAAAVKLQKVYKSYRTRRNLADCAVVVEELWWKALDFQSLKRSSISFFEEKEAETAVSRWARARTRAAKVGKGLSKDEKAQKLALQHWLEAIDPRHRYGHNLNLYYDVWFNSESSEPFFYWLDVGAGKEVNLEKCSRCKLQQQCIEYLGPKERRAYEVIVQRGKLVYRQSQIFVNTEAGSKWIFVLSTSRKLYVGKKKKGAFQHSSFLSGGATTAAGRLVAEDGILKAVWPYSGHYLPTEENFKEFIGFLTDNNVDLTDVKRCSVDDDDFSFGRKDPETDMGVTNSENSPDFTEGADSASQVKEITYQPTKRLSCKWTSGAGPRIGCVRDYPLDLQFKALEQVNLSPRLAPSPPGSKRPIPSPRPSPGVRLSPRLAYMGIPSPRISLTLPKELKA